MTNIDTRNFFEENKYNSIFIDAIRNVAEFFLGHEEFTNSWSLLEFFRELQENSQKTQNAFDLILERLQFFGYQNNKETRQTLFQIIVDLDRKLEKAQNDLDQSMW